MESPAAPGNNIPASPPLPATVVVAAVPAAAVVAAVLAAVPAAAVPADVAAVVAAGNNEPAAPLIHETMP